jgi:uncharacterized membrane protein (Fun14 family)
LNEVVQLLVPFAFSGLCGYISGYALRKILRVVFKISAITLGAFFLALFYMQYTGYVTVDWEKLGTDLYGFAYNTVNTTFSVNSNGNLKNADPISKAVDTVVEKIGYSTAGGFGGGLIVGFFRTK